MKLRDQMVLTNIAAGEDSAIDIGGNWIEDDICHVALRLNEDDQEDIEFHMLLTTENLQILRDWIEYKLAESPSKLN